MAHPAMVPRFGSAGLGECSHSVAPWPRILAGFPGVCLLGLGFSILLFVFLSSGMSSSNSGTYFRKTEPVRFWADIGLLSAGYSALCFFGYLWR